MVAGLAERWAVQMAKWMVEKRAEHWVDQKETLKAVQLVEH